MQDSLEKLYVESVLPTEARLFLMTQTSTMLTEAMRKNMLKKLYAHLGNVYLSSFHSSKLQISEVNAAITIETETATTEYWP